MTRVVVTLGAGADVAFPALGSDRAAHVAGGRRRRLAVNRRAARSSASTAALPLPRHLELSALNRDPRAVVPASPLLRSAVRAALWAAERSGGLVDPCLLDALEAAGYDARTRRPPTHRFPAARPRRGARPPRRAGGHRRRRRRRDDRPAAGPATRPRRLGQGPRRRPRRAALLGPAASGSSTAAVTSASGSARRSRSRIRCDQPGRRLPSATPPSRRRAWSRARGNTRRGRAPPPARPRGGPPARTGLLSATAIAPTTLHAETLAKAGCGPRGARRALAGGGVLVHEDGRVETSRPPRAGRWSRDRPRSRRVRLVAGLPRRRRHRAAVHHGLRRRRPGDGRPLLRPRSPATLLAVHQQTALVGLVAIAVHGITLLGDEFLRPSIGDIAIPFTSDHAPLWTGLGVTGGWLAAILGLTYWARERIGAARCGAAAPGDPARLRPRRSPTRSAPAPTRGEPWMRGSCSSTGAPVLFLFVMRVLTPRPGPRFRRYRVAGVMPESRDVPLVRARARRGAGARLRRRPVRHGPRSPAWPAAELLAVARARGNGSGSASSASGAMSGAPASSLEVGHARDRRPERRVRPGQRAGRPVALLSAGIGATPVLAMLHALAERRAAREVWWIHGARSGREHAFRAEARALLARCHGAVARPLQPPGAARQPGRDFTDGRITADTVLELGVPLDAEFRLCGPTRFVRDLPDGLRAAGHPSPQRGFGGRALPAPRRARRRRAGGPAVSFARSGVATTWDRSYGCLLDLAEANAVAARSGCRVGACHGCRTPSSTATCATSPSRSTRRRRAQRCCAAPGRKATSCSMPSRGGDRNGGRVGSRSGAAVCATRGADLTSTGKRPGARSSAYREESARDRSGAGSFRGGGRRAGGGIGTAAG